mmetsp:Transcript_88785/g.237584  ORF Transcript_88785/g.237584 Transcript_88785/m.237584 type:complete len:88 (+) Transcript_88785:1080-1343(+)
MEWLRAVLHPLHEARGSVSRHLRLALRLIAVLATIEHRGVFFPPCSRFLSRPCDDRVCQQTYVFSFVLSVVHVFLAALRTQYWSFPC